MKCLVLGKSYINLTNCIRREEGQAFSEYSVILMLIVIVAIGASTSLGASVVELLKNAIDAILL